MNSAARSLRVLLALALVLAVLLGLALVIGSGGQASETGGTVLTRTCQALWALPGQLLQPDDSVASEILHRLRLPRALAAAAVGALLALSGALMQVLLRNPLADPYVLGLSGGAALGALTGLALGCSLWVVNAGALAGALAVVLTVLGLARQDLGRLEASSSQDSSPQLLLTGVMLSSLSMAGISLILSLAPTERLRGMLFWMMGDLSGAEAPWWLLLAPLAVCLLLVPLGRDLNLLLRGPGPAQMLGVPVRRLRGLIYLLASACAALAVTTAGSVGFVGLVVPHVLRLLLGNDQRLLLPASALAGAGFLLAADTAARSLAAPLMLPVGVITALVGAPTFIALLSRKARP